jgi:hypothetical protein
VRLVALRIGTGVPTQPFAGVVRSVFVNAAILTVGDGLVTLVTAAAGGLPGAVNVAVPRGFNFMDFIAVGAAAASRAGVLRFAGSVASIDLREARQWRSCLRAISLDFRNPAVESAWRSVAAALRTDGRSDAIARLARGDILLLGAATRHFDLESAEQAAARLIGLGAGATPAGDDLIVGYLAGLWSSIAGIPARAVFAAGLGAALLSLAKQTNDHSGVYLAAAAAGEASERLAAVAACIAGGSTPTTLAEAAAAAIAVGHSSGADGVLGLLLGLAAWGPEAIFSESRRLVDETLPAAGVESWKSPR